MSWAYSRPPELADTRGMLTESASTLGPSDHAASVSPQLLRAVPLFRELEDEQLIAEIAHLVSVQRYRKHETIVREGDPGESFYVVVAGSVAVVRVASDGRETILSILEAERFLRRDEHLLRHVGPIGQRAGFLTRRRRSASSIVRTS